MSRHNQSRKLVGISSTNSHCMPKPTKCTSIRVGSRAGTGVCNLVVDLICILRIHALYAGSRKGERGAFLFSLSPKCNDSTVLVSLLVLTFGRFGSVVGIGWDLKLTSWYVMTGLCGVSSSYCLCFHPPDPYVRTDRILPVLRPNELPTLTRTTPLPLRYGTLFGHEDGDT